MESDLKLDGNQVRIEACDLVVEAAERRGNSNGPRRALVHDFDDGLTINWANDYPGGVTIEGAHTINGVRIIRKDDGFAAPVTIEGGVDVSGGNLHLTRGGRVVFSDPNPADDFVSGEIFQDDDGLHVAGSPVAKPSKPVVVHGPVARKTYDFGSAGSGASVAPRARASTTGSTGMVTLAAGPRHEVVRVSRPSLGGAMTVEFDVVETLVELMHELTELRNRVKALEGG